MKKKLELEDEPDLEILKAVAQAWHSHTGSSKPMNEFDASRRNFKGNPSRFKLQATSKSSAKDVNSKVATWDFGQSLCDSYEIVTLSKRLEVGLLESDNIPFTGLDSQSRVHRRRKESKHSLRNLLNKISSRRYNESAIPPEKDNLF